MKQVHMICQRLFRQAFVLLRVVKGEKLTEAPPQPPLETEVEETPPEDPLHLKDLHLVCSKAT